MPDPNPPQSETNIAVVANTRPTDIHASIVEAIWAGKRERVAAGFRKLASDSETVAHLKREVEDTLAKSSKYTSPAKRAPFDSKTLSPRSHRLGSRDTSPSTPNSRGQAAGDVGLDVGRLAVRAISTHAGVQVKNKANPSRTMTLISMILLPDA
jgi:hypothetical protein